MNRVATVGTFDGVHRGHLEVIDTLKREGAEHGLCPVVITFDRHPLATIAPERVPGRLMSVADERDALDALGVEVMVLRFDESLRRMTASEWMRLLSEKYGVTRLVMGYDNTFGNDGRGKDPAWYAQCGASLGLPVVFAPEIEGISSSAIREALRVGDFSSAIDMLGHTYRLEGEVIHGDALGRKIGFPTANLSVDPMRLIPANGVYAGMCGDPTLPCLVNIGTRPTVGGTDRRIEVHIPGWSGDLYGKPLAIDLNHRIRGERRFSSLTELQNQITRDIKEI